MRGTKISLLGLYNANPDLFNDFAIPSQLTASVLIDNLLLETSDLEIIYPDADFMQRVIGSWSAMMINNWQKQADTLYEDYDPFINLKRDEERIITQDRDLENALNVNAWNDPTESGVRRNTSTDKGVVTTREEYHMTGDSAIKDAQDVARAEINLRNDFIMYQIIIKDFMKKFCLLVY